MAEYRFDGSLTRIAGVRPGAVLVVAADDAVSTVGELWPTLSADSTTAVLERLTARGLGATPDFALVTWSGRAGSEVDSVRVIVRGAFEVAIGDVRVSGVDVSTWAERLLEAPAQFEIDAIGADAAADWLPLLEGVVAAGRITVGEQAPTTMPTRAARESSAPVSLAAPPAPPSGPAIRSTPAPPEPPVRAMAPTPAFASEQTIAPLIEETMTDFIEPIRSPVPSTAPVDAGDHDGMTIASVDIQRLRAERDAVADATAGRPARRPAQPTAAQPRLRMPDGTFEPISHEVVLGRAPSISKVSGGRIPRLVTLGHGDPDISRSHVRFALEGGTVVVTDLHSRNGTLVVAPGKPPVKLRAGEPTPVLIGTVVDLGGGWTLQVVDG